MNRFACHKAAMDHENRHNGVELEHTPREPDTARDGLVDCARVDPVGHEGVQTQRGGDGRALKVGGLTRGVLGDVAAVGGDVEAREAGQAAEDEEGEANVVERGAHADGEGDDCGGETEGNLYIALVRTALPFFLTLTRTQVGEGRGRRHIPNPLDYPTPVPSYCSSSSSAQPCRP